MNILFYTPFNSRSRDTESLMQAFVKQGHSVFLLTQTGRGPYHEQCAQLGVKVHHYEINNGNPFIYFIKHALRLWKFSSANQIDVIYAHLEKASFPAVIIQYFVSAKVFACRHVIDEAYMFGNRNYILLNKIVYRLARKVIVVSDLCKTFMIEKERVKESKILVIYLAYNFNLYPTVNQDNVREIRSSYPCQLLLLAAGRLVGFKRPDYSVQVVKKLAEKGLDCKLILLGEGTEYESLKLEIERSQIQDRAFLLGFKSNILDYIAACDIIIHPSISESSSVIIKEAGLQERTVIACRGVGDFDEYLVHKKNAFLVSPGKTVEEMSEVIGAVYSDRSSLIGMGKALKKSVVERFSIENILPEYNKIHLSIEATKNLKG